MIDSMNASDAVVATIAAEILTVPPRHRWRWLMEQTTGTPDERRTFAGRVFTEAERRGKR